LAVVGERPKLETAVAIGEAVAFPFSAGVIEPNRNVSRRFAAQEDLAADRRAIWFRQLALAAPGGRAYRERDCVREQKLYGLLRRSNVQMAQTLATRPGGQFVGQASG